MVRLKVFSTFCFLVPNLFSDLLDVSSAASERSMLLGGLFASIFSSVARHRGNPLTGNASPSFVKRREMMIFTNLDERGIVNFSMLKVDSTIMAEMISLESLM